MLGRQLRARRRSVRRHLDNVLDDAMADTGAHGGAVYLLVPGEDVLALEVGAGIPPHFAAPWNRVGLASSTVMTEAARTRELVWVGTQEEMARRFPATAVALPYPFALASAPLVTGDSLWGVMIFVWSSAHPPSLGEHERGTVLAACDRLAVLLHRAAAAGEPVSPAPYPRTLTRGAGSAPAQEGGPATQDSGARDFVDRLPGEACGLDPEGRFSFVTPGAAELLGADASDLLGKQARESLPWLDDPAYEDRFRHAVVSRRPISFTAMRPPGRWLHFHLYPGDGGMSVLVNPVDTSSRPPPPADDGPGITAGPPTRVGAIQHLMQLAGTLAEAATVRDVADIVADRFLPAFGAQGLALLVADAGRLRIVGHRGYPAGVIERFDGLPLTSHSPGADALLDNKVGYFGTRAELDAAYPQRLADQDGMAAWAFLPLATSGHRVGCCVLAYDRPHTFHPDERAALTSLSGLVAQTLDRAQVYDSARNLAHGLQSGLLPHALPEVPGLEVAARYLPSTRGMEVGGDFYDVIRIGEHEVAAVIGDVEGHDVAAAALMGQIRTAVHAHTTAGSSPHTVLARTNHLLGDLEPGLFASCLYLSVDLEHGRARMATAGHLPPLLRRPDGYTDILEAPPGALLGIDPTTEYTTTEVDLPAGSVLALYTDGLVETPRADIDEAIAALAVTLGRSRTPLLDVLAEELITPNRDAENRTDDTALLLLRTTTPPAHDTHPHG